jgi:Trypsin-like peptidase domain
MNNQKALPQFLRPQITLVALVILSFFVFGDSYGQSKGKELLPLSTVWTTDRAYTYNPGNIIFSVCMIVNVDAGEKGTGCLLRSGYVITNYHVIKGARASSVFSVSPDGKQHRVTGIISDSIRDLAILSFADILIGGGFDFGNEDSLKIGDRVFTWGYPLQYNGPTPVLSVGYVSGIIFRPDSITNQLVKHLIINGAFNSGNSGGPLIGPDGKIYGIVQSKALPVLSPTTESAIDALAHQTSGFTYTKTDPTGKKTTYSEGQVVSQILTEYRDLGQVNIGEAICITELSTFLKENNISRK